MAKAVLLDIDSYEKQKNTLLMLKLIAQGEEDIKNGNLIPGIICLAPFVIFDEAV
ncbi:MAG: hypothetical protein GY757_24620 [bacterium]|nr:hypothetical protein [bacterium]